MSKPPVNPPGDPPRVPPRTPPPPDNRPPNKPPRRSQLRLAECVTDIRARLNAPARPVSTRSAAVGLMSNPGGPVPKPTLPPTPPPPSFP